MQSHSWKRVIEKSTFWGFSTFWGQIWIEPHPKTQNEKKTLGAAFKRIILPNLSTWKFTFYVGRKSGWQFLVQSSIVENCDSDFIFGKNHMRPWSTSGYPVSTPSGLKTIIFPFHFDISTLTFDSVWRTQIMKCGQ